MVTHDEDIARRVTRAITVADGLIVGEVANRQQDIVTPLTQIRTDLA
jgi:ABC-type lipoprotein export system ATPase subunit